MVIDLFKINRQDFCAFVENLEMNGENYIKYIVIYINFIIDIEILKYKTFKGVW